MRKYFLLSILLIISQNALAIQDQETDYKQYKGKIVDSKSNKPLVFATITIVNSNISTISNTEGEFLLKVPEKLTNGKVNFSFLGYTSKIIDIVKLHPNKNKIALDISVTELSGVDINIPKDAKNLVRQVLYNRSKNYVDDPTLMTAFYRETIKKRRKNVSLSEAVVNIYKAPYSSSKKDAVQLYKSRKSTDYKKLDTVALKLQGGPFNALYVDLMKYPEFIFKGDLINAYEFTYSRSTYIDQQLVYVIDFKQYPSIKDPLYKGQLFIDPEKMIFTSALYSLNITDKRLAAKLFVRRKPAEVDVWPIRVNYRIDYQEKNGKWHYGYSNVIMSFKVDWKKKLFNSVYSMIAEMAVTDWEKNSDGKGIKQREQLKKSVILGDEALGFSDPDFWGEFNIIEPEKSIETAIKKIKRQLKKIDASDGAVVPEVLINQKR